MKKKLSKKSKRRVLLISVVSLSLTFLIVGNLISVWGQLISKSNEKKFYESELARLNEEEDYLKVESEKLQDPDYIARYAREQYLYSKDGEFNIRIN